MDVGLALAVLIDSFWTILFIPAMQPSSAVWTKRLNHATQPLAV